jgi:hypothetical protein
LCRHLIRRLHGPQASPSKRCRRYRQVRRREFEALAYAATALPLDMRLPEIRVRRSVSAEKEKECINHLLYLMLQSRALERTLWKTRIAYHNLFSCAVIPISDTWIETTWMRYRSAHPPSLVCWERWRLFWFLPVLEDNIRNSCLGMITLKDSSHSFSWTMSKTYRLFLRAAITLLRSNSCSHHFRC